MRQEIGAGILGLHYQLSVPGHVSFGAHLSPVK